MKKLKVLKWSRTRGHIEAGIKVFEEIDSKEQGAATSRQGIMRIRACGEDNVKTMEGSLYLYASPLDFFQSSLGSSTSPRVPLLGTGDDQPSVHKERPPP